MKREAEREQNRARGRERERERKKKQVSERERDGKRERERKIKKRQRQKESERERDRKRQKESEGQRDRERKRPLSACHASRQDGPTVLQECIKCRSQSCNQSICHVVQLSKTFPAASYRLILSSRLRNEHSLMFALAQSVKSPGSAHYVSCSNTLS